MRRPAALAAFLLLAVSARAGELGGHEPAAPEPATAAAAQRLRLERYARDAWNQRR